MFSAGGTYSCLRDHHKEPRETEWSVRAKTSHPELHEFSLAQRTAEDEYASASFQAGRFVVGRRPSGSRQEEVMQDIERRYPRTAEPEWVSEVEGDAGPGGQRFQAAFKIALASTVRDASPGLPYMVEYKTNAEVIEHIGEVELAREVYSRLRRLGDGGWNGSCETDDLWCAAQGANTVLAEDLVHRGLCDPVKLFVKNEPHGTVKVQQKRFRLISSVSLIDVLVERMLFSRQNREEIERWDDIPSKPGMGLDDEGLRKIAQNIAEIPDPAEADVSGWDWSVQGWELEFEARARCRLMSAGTYMTRLIRNRYLCIGLSQFVFSDGSIHNQRVFGLMKSGSYITSSSNSRIRYAVAKFVGAEQAMTMGDDCVETFVDDGPARYLELGHRLKMYSKCTDSVEFCSTKFDFAKGTVLPCNAVKMAFSTLNKKPANAAVEEQIRDSLAFELRHDSSSLEWVHKVLSGAGWPRQIACE